MKTSDMLNVEINKLNYIRSYTYLYFFLKMETPTIFGIHSFILKPGFTCAFNITQSFIGFCENSIIQYSVFELPSFCVSYSITSFFLSFSTQVLLISFFVCLFTKKKLHIGYYPIVLEQLIARKRSFKDVIAYIPFFLQYVQKTDVQKERLRVQ